MVYYIPQQYECPRCKFTMEYSQHHNPSGGPVVNNQPICPKCYVEWLKSNFPVMIKQGESNETT